MIPPDRDVSNLSLSVQEGWASLCAVCRRLKIDLKMSEGCRDKGRQAELYAQGRTTPGPIVTNAKPGESNHEPDEFGQGWAVDFMFGGPEPFAEEHPWELVGMMAERLGFSWGGRWKKPDRPHLEMARPA